MSQLVAGEQRLTRSFEEMKDDWRKYCGYWKAYPDRFIDMIRPADCRISLYFYQRMMLRILFRYREVYFTFTRGTAKSFTQILALYLKCIMFPQLNLFICAPGKEQAAKISRENIENIWNFFPILKDEVKKARFEKDYVILYFHNGSRLDVVQVENSSRGGRRHGGAVEEIVEMDSKRDELNSVVIPMMANDRIAMCKGKDPSEQHKFQFYVTTAGTRQSFAYEKMKEIMQAMVEGKSAFCIGAGYELACMHGQLDIDFIHELKLKPTFNPLSFAREYESSWTGSSENSLVQIDSLTKCRALTKPEFKSSLDKTEKEKEAFYVLAYDVARAEGKANASCALVVLKCIPRSDGTYSKHVVNIFSFEGTHFLKQARFLKRKVVEFDARMLVVDVNGLGKGLVDQLVLEIDENPPYSVVNDDRYDKYKTDDSIPMIYGVSSNTKDQKASDIHRVFVNYIERQDVKLLVSESYARQEKFKNDKKLDDSERSARVFLPFTMTDLLFDEVMNLEQEQVGNQMKVKQISKQINKDKFSALEYGLFYIYQLEMKNQIRVQQRADSWKFMAVKKAKTSYAR